MDKARTCLLNEDIDCGELWDNEWVKIQERDADKHGYNVNYLDVAKGWPEDAKNWTRETPGAPFKPLCPRGVYTTEMAWLLERFNIISVFKSYPIDRLTHREVEAIMVIKAESNNMEEEHIDDMKRETENRGHKR